MQRLTRRRVVRATGVAAASAVAGCATRADDSPDEGYERLHRSAVHVDEDVDLQLPDEVGTASANNADLLVLPGDTGVGAGRAVDWLADERVVALLGEGAEGTWLSWARSDDYRDAFRGEGAADGDPDPDLLAAAAVGLDVTTYRHTWADGPRDRDVLRELDEVLVDVADRTPR